ncbi:unnamed protein product [Mytilus edulis]|uniref:Uncharacterized protein n=1 Tax=Mytilus edulis TaxID=6550 RepID=A0A8S3VKR2_MYTED|nr:unnamed protein product [Mytilus edulis]
MWSFTTRPDIFSELKKLFENRPFFYDFLTVDLNSVGFTFAEKVEMFRTHEQKCNGLKFDDNSVNAICKCDTPSFPNCIDMFFTNAMAYKRGLQFFKNPTQFLNTEINQIFREDKALYTLLVMLAMNDDRLSKCNLLETIKATHKDILKVLLDTSNADCPKQIKAMLIKVLEKSQSFLQVQKELVMFRYKCISNAVCASFGEMMPEEALMYLPIEFVFQNVFVDGSNHSKDDEGIVVPRSCHIYLAKRLVAELERGCIEQVCRHSAFTSPCFSCCFFTELKEKGKHQIRFILQMTERSQKNRALWNGSLLYWSAAVGQENLLLRLLMEDMYKDLEDKFFVRTQASAALQCASQRRFPKTVISKLIDLHADVNTSLHLSKREQTYNCDHCNLQDQNGITPLQSSIFGSKEINLENVELILKSGVLFKENAVSYRPLIMAVKKRHVQLIELLLKYDIDINAFDNDLHSALYYCVEQDDIDTLNLIMKKSKFQYKANENLLIVCSSRKMATYLIDHNIDTNIKFKDENDKSILHHVRSKELVSFYIERGCSVHYIDKFGQTPIFCARSSDILESLLDFHPNLHHTDKKRRNILHYFTDTSLVSLICLQMTAENKKNLLNSPDVHGRTPIFYAATVEMLDLLLSNGAVVIHKAKEYSTRNSVSETYDSGVGEIIYSRGMDDDNSNTTKEIYLQNWVTFNTKKTTSSVDVSCSHDVQYEMATLSSSGDCSNACDSETHSDNLELSDCEINYDHCKSNYNVLMWSVLQGKLNIDTLSVFLKYDIDVSERDEKGHTIFHYLLSPFERIRNIPSIMAEILKYNDEKQRKANTITTKDILNMQDCHGNTALHFACACRAFNKLKRQESEEIMHLLLDNGANRNNPNKCQETPLHYLLKCRCRTNEAVYILSTGVNVNGFCIQKWQPMHFVLSIQDFGVDFIDTSKEIISKLIEAGACIASLYLPEGFFPSNCNPILLDYILTKLNLSETVVHQMVENCKNSRNCVFSWANLAIIDSNRNIANCREPFENVSESKDFSSKHSVFKRCSQVLQNEYLLLCVLSFLFKDSKDDINLQDEEGNTILMTAVRGSRGIRLDMFECVKFLLNQGANPNMKNHAEQSVISQCILSNGNEKYVQRCLCEMINHGAIIADATHYKDAAKSSKLRASILKLIPDQVYSNMKYTMGNSFHYLVRSYSQLYSAIPSIASISEYVNKGIDINGKNDQGETPLHLALRMNTPIQVVTELLRNGAKINIENDNGETVFHYLFIYTTVSQWYIFEEFVNYNKDCLYNEKALHLLVSKMTPDVLKILYVFLNDSSVNINTKDTDCNSVLHNACTGNTNDDSWCISMRPHVVRLLVAKGVHLNEVDASGCTVLHMVIMQYNKLSRNNPQRCDVRHLHNLISIVSIFLSNCADLSVKDKEGKTALDYLEEFKLSDVQAMIDRKMTPEEVNEKTVSSIIYNMYKGCRM